MKNSEEFKIERKKLKETIGLVKENLENENAYYDKIEQTTTDEYMLYKMARTYATKIKNLKRALKNPYFARIDFKADDEKKTKELYIGKTNIFDDNLDVVVADWRAPISSVYYDGQIGRTQYKCPEGIIKGDLRKKRQYIIENAELINYNDIDITTNDELLQECLSENSDNRLKNIISTIQSEQNKIIRANMFKPLIVQGVAGSGKTTIALHRIAYLVYTYEKRFRPEEFLIIAPNKFFLDYISNVLPDLGVDYVRQQTFEEFALEIINSKIKIKNPNIELSKIVNEGNDKTVILQKVANFKSSLKFKEVIDKYLEELNREALPKEDFRVAECIAIKYEELQEMLMSNNEKISLKERIENLKNFMQKRLADISNNLIDEITTKRKEKIDKLPNTLNEDQFQEERLKIFEATEYEISALIKGGKKLVTDYIKKIKNINILEHYKNVITNQEYLSGNLGKEEINYIVNECNQNLKRKTIEFEDLGAILYLQYKIFGLNEKFNLQHIVIDEAQDFSEFQFYVLNKILNNKSITILGDIAQGIYSYRGTKNWDKINQLVFENEAVIQKLENSYRTTPQIMNEANKILENIRKKENLSLAIPVARNGEEVNYIKTKNIEDKIDKIIKRVNELKNKGYKNIAIITKNSIDSEKVYNKIYNQIEDVEIVTENLEEYKGGVTILPSYISKGLEFDSVIIFDYDSYDNTAIDIKLLYVAFTRAMHTLDVLN